MEEKTTIDENLKKIHNLVDLATQEKSYIDLLLGYCEYVSDSSQEIINASLLIEEINKLNSQLYESINEYTDYIYALKNSLR